MGRQAQVRREVGLGGQLKLQPLSVLYMEMFLCLIAGCY